MELSIKYKSTLTEQLFTKKILFQYNFSLYIHIYCQITNFGSFAAFSPAGVFPKNQAACPPVGAFKNQIGFYIVLIFQKNSKRKKIGPNGTEYQSLPSSRRTPRPLLAYLVQLGVRSMPSTYRSRTMRSTGVTLRRRMTLWWQP